MERYNALFSLTGKKALISGGTGGLGSAIAEAFLQQGAEVAVCGSFLQQGAEVAVCGRNPDKARDMKETADKAGQKLYVFECDITCRTEMERLLCLAEEELGGVDILVNSAGMNCLLPAEDYGDQEFSQVMELNIHALHRLTKYPRAAPFDQRGGEALDDSRTVWADPKPLFGKKYDRHDGKLCRVLCQQGSGQHVHAPAGL